MWRAARVRGGGPVFLDTDSSESAARREAVATDARSLRPWYVAVTMKATSAQGVLVAGGTAGPAGSLLPAADLGPGPTRPWSETAPGRSCRATQCPPGRDAVGGLAAT